ncbi:hypothetical protein RI129_001930 [Pyrocoelia pectoralis]|uniref:Cytochrome P450 n=1 Tax=Pyrocoelia pectoralis TaxID=417401 RepID=A0AAN7ZXS7_9COLE
MSFASNSSTKINHVHLYLPITAKMGIGFWYILGCVLLILIIKYHWSRRRIYQVANLLQGPPTVPIFGNALLFRCKEEDIFGTITKVIDTYPSPMRLWLGPKLVVVVKTASHIEKVLTSPSAAYKDDIYKCLTVFNGDSLFTSNGVTWKKQKRLVTPFLGSRYMDAYLRVISRCCDTLMEKIEEVADGRLINVDYYLYRYYNDVVNETLTGYNPGAQHGKIDFFISLCHEAYILLHSRMTKAWLHPDFIFKRSNSGRRQTYISEIFRKFLHQNIKLANGNNNNGEGFKSIYKRVSEEKEKHPQLYGDQSVMDHIATLYSAAEDTTTTICSYLLVLLGMHPTVQEKVMEEMRDVVGTVVENITYKDMCKLYYLGMCIKETMRIFPIAPYILRKLSDDLEIDNTTMPKGTSIFLSLYSVQKSSEHWEKPNEFYPEHFLPETVTNRHPYAFLPFSSGVHSCPGQLFAVCAIKAVAISILSRFVVEADGTLQDIKIKADISVRSINGYKLRLRKRFGSFS